MFNELFLSDIYFTNSNMRLCDDDSDGDAAPDVQAPPPASGDISALTGAPAQPSAPIAAPAPNVQGNPAVYDPSSGQAATSGPAGSTSASGGGTNLGAAPAGQLNLQQPPPPPAAAPAPAAPAVPTMGGQPSPWKQLVMGALIGASQGAGGKGFGQGMARGGEAVTQANQQRIENAQNAQKLQFESVQAANDMIRARNEARAADDAHEEHAQTLQTQQMASQERLEEMGITPKLTISGSSPAETHAQAAGGLQTLANQNGGTIPRVATTNAPDSTSDDGKTHTIHVYSVSPQDITSNPNGTLDLINDDRKVKGLPPISQSDLQIAAGQVKPGNWRAGAADMANDALQHLYTVPTPDAEPAKNAAMQAHLQQQLDTYKQSTDANPNTVKVLQSQLDAFGKAAENQRAITARAESNTTLETAPAKATAAGMEQQAKNTVDANSAKGRAELANAQQELIDKKYSNAENHQKALFNEGQDPVTGEKLNLSNAPDEALIDGNTKQPIPTKMLSTLKPTQQESNRADFATSALHSLDIIDDLKAQGKLPNGPISGWTTKGLEKAGVNSEDAAQAIGLVALTQSAATGAHVGGRFSAQIMDKMNGLLTMNSNDSQFAGQEKALRDVMTPYAQRGGRETVAQYKQSVIGTTVTDKKSGRTGTVTGFDKNGQMVVKANQAGQ
jgi:hypothetical protein